MSGRENINREVGISGGGTTDDGSSEKIYIGFASQELTHYFNNLIGVIHARSQDELEPCDKEEIKLILENFIKKIQDILKKTSEGKFRIDEIASISDIQGVLDVAESITDPTDPAQIKRLYDVYEPIAKRRNAVKRV